MSSAGNAWMSVREVISVKVWLTCTVTRPATAAGWPASLMTVTVASPPGLVSSGWPAGRWVRKPMRNSTTRAFTLCPRKVSLVR